MKIKWSKALIGFAITIGVMTATTVAVSAAFVATNDISVISPLKPNQPSSPPPIPPSTSNPSPEEPPVVTKEITQQIVLDNFKEGGIWNGKTSLLASDFGDYNTIAIDAFDDPSIALDSVQLPHAMILSNADNNAIKWKGIKQITTDRTNIEYSDGFFVNDNVLYYSYDYGFYKYLVATTVADRSLNMTLMQLGVLEHELIPAFNYDNCTIVIPIDFYDIDIFQNVQSISISTDFDKNFCSILICDNAFMNCQKITSVGIFNHNYFYDWAYIGNNAFKGSSITKLDLVCSRVPIYLGTDAFRNCNQLVNINLTSPLILTSNNCFTIDTAMDHRKVCILSNGFYINPDEVVLGAIMMSDSMLSGEYNSLELELYLDNQAIMTDNVSQKALNGIILKDPTKLSIKSYLTYSELQAIGLPSEFNESNLTHIDPPPRPKPPQGAYHG